MNRKETLRLVEAIGERLDLRQDAASALADEGTTSGEFLESMAYEELDFIVRHGGEGGALYRMRFLDVKPQPLKDAVEQLRTAIEFRSKQERQQR